MELVAIVFFVRLSSKTDLPNPTLFFVEEFAELLTHFISIYDKILILGNFNIHLCYPSQPFVHDFVHTLESFIVTQAIQEPTYVKDHTLDLVLYNGLSPNYFKVEDICVPDHKAILFSMIFSQLPFNHSTLVRHRVFNSSSASKFSELFSTAFLSAFKSPF